MAPVVRAPVRRASRAESGPDGQAGHLRAPVGVDAHAGQADLGEECGQGRGEALVAIGVEVGTGLVDAQGDRVGAAVVQAQGVLGVEDAPLDAVARRRRTVGSEHLLAVEAASAQLQRDPPVGAGERHEGGVGPGGDIKEDRAALAGGQSGEVALADTQRGGGIGWDEFEEHEPGLSGEYRLSGGVMR